MRIIVFIQVFVLCLVFFACEQGDLSNQHRIVDSPVLKNAIDPRQSMFMKPYFDHYSHFDSIDDEAKKLIWANKYAQLSSLAWSEDEQKVIDSLFSYLHLDIFDQNSQNFQDLVAIEEGLLDYALSTFSPDEVVRIFLQPQDFNDTIGQVYAIPGGRGTKHCNCEWDLSCSTLPQERWCEGTKCEKTMRGCGWFWVSGCSHICDKGLGSVRLE